MKSQHLAQTRFLNLQLSVLVFDVTKGKIVQAVAEGHHTIGDIKAVTGAGTGCGGCIQLVTSVLNAELAGVPALK